MAELISRLVDWTPALRKRMIDVTEKLTTSNINGLSYTLDSQETDMLGGLCRGIYATFKEYAYKSEEDDSFEALTQKVNKAGEEGVGLTFTRQEAKIWCSCTGAWLVKAGFRTAEGTVVPHSKGESQENLKSFLELLFVTLFLAVHG